jgi:pSer/pThr/pTyr-binding forkhead associated (FHA) protein
MQDVTITFTGGPQQGRRIEVEVTREGVAIGRLPGPGGVELKSADSSISREHAKLIARGGEVELENLSANGTVVDGKLVLDRVLLQPNVEIKIGDTCAFSVDWTSFNADVTKEKKEEKSTATPGPLASPIVRAVVGVYVLGIVGVGVWLAMEDETIAGDDWPALEKVYEKYEPDGDAEASRAARMDRAKDLVDELRVHKTRGIDRENKIICREIMSLDADVNSPFFRYGASCLSEN